MSNNNTYKATRHLHVVPGSELEKLEKRVERPASTHNRLRHIPAIMAIGVLALVGKATYNIVEEPSGLGVPYNYGAQQLAKLPQVKVTPDQSQAVMGAEEIAVVAKDGVDDWVFTGPESNTELGVALTNFIRAQSPTGNIDAGTTYHVPVIPEPK